MAKGYELEGTIHLINDVQTFPSGFSKREFVVEAQDGQYTQKIKFECVKDKTTLVDGLSQGDAVKVFFDIRGNEYNEKFFVNLNAWKIEKSGAGGSGTGEGGSSGGEFPVDDGSAGPPSNASEPPADFSEKEEDDIPF